MTGQRKTFWEGVGKAVFVIALVVIFQQLLGTGSPIDRSFQGAGASRGVWLALAALVYLLSHLFRALRLAMLVGSHQVSLRRLTQVHFFTAGVSLLLPFKLGEVYRVVELRTVIGSTPRALLTVWIERAFDAGILLLMIVCARLLTGGDSELGYVPLVVVSAAFLVLTLLGLLVLPENLQALSLFILRRYRSERAVAAMRAIRFMLDYVRHGQQVVAGKYAAVCAISALVWLLELLAFGFVLNAGGLDWIALLHGFLGYVSEVSLGHGFDAVWAAVDGNWPLLTAISVYGVLVRGALLVVALLAGLIYTPRRLTSSESQLLRRL